MDMDILIVIDELTNKENGKGPVSSRKRIFSVAKRYDKN